MERKERENSNILLGLGAFLLLLRLFILGAYMQINLRNQ
ncbi:unnamed protein product [Musa acuminata subsp. malaccensis]|uniref:(wild Malaysian banana) hypothetical protein n=1 Tax=Musa acuminata subsp. malaccensis TaxID=214687 RepID=A0A804HWN5_MUSAM|nr:unnamed protein product [Musa acuminata subsp. malaccensis]